jgi:hypothetical protein
VYAYKNYIFAYAVYGFPGDTVVVLAPEKAPEPAGTGNHQGYDIPRFHVKLDITDKSQAMTCADVYDLSALELGDANNHKNTPSCFKLYETDTPDRTFTPAADAYIRGI